MEERAEELAALQELLDHSYAVAGSHLRAIHTPGARLDADRLFAADMRVHTQDPEADP